LSIYPNNSFTLLLLGKVTNTASNDENKELVKLYDKTFEAYKNNNFEEVKLLKAEADKKYSGNNLRPKFEFLLALSVGKTGKVDEFKQALTFITKEFPKTDVSEEAKQMLLILNKTEKKIELVKLDSALVDFELEPNEKHYYVFAIKNVKANFTDYVEKTYAYNEAFAANDNLRINALMSNEGYQYLLVREFANQKKAEEYKTRQNSPKKESIVCECGKKYKFGSGLWKHKKTCYFTEKKALETNTNTYDKQIIQMLLKENSELKNMVMEVCKNAQPSNTHISNTNSHNKTFNLQFFLNEQCKDAMNIMDFVNSIKLQISDLESVGKLGYVNGMHKIIVNNLNALDIHKRPVHCSDAKREIMYVKDEDKWEKENEEKKKLKKAIKQITHKNISLISEWKNKFPDCIYSDSLKSDQYNHIIIESMGGAGTDNDTNENKIIKLVSKDVLIEKEKEKE
jgi:hypothetical protein